MAQLAHVERAALQRRILLDTFFHGVTRYDRIIRLTALFFTAVTPAVRFLGEQLEVPQLVLVGICTGVIATALAKIPDMLRLNKTIGAARTQLTQYDNLLDRIELQVDRDSSTVREMFVRDYESIVRGDPDIPRRYQLEARAAIKAAGIHMDSDIDRLRRVVDHSDEPPVAPAPTIKPPLPPTARSSDDILKRLQKIARDAQEDLAESPV